MKALVWSWFQIDKDPQRFSNVKNAVDGISSFPQEAEEPQVSLVERKASVISPLSQVTRTYTLCISWEKRCAV